MSDTTERSPPKAWPFAEAARLLAVVEARRATGDDRPALLETGYGPSGLPHVGTFGEVARTQWVRLAYATLSGGAPTRLISFSDDMDGLRKVPGNVPNGEMLARHLGQPLSRIPDPFGTHPSFGAHNNARLRAFLDGFGFDYEFASATECYESGRFDAALRRVLERHDAIVRAIAPTLGPERRATYSPVLPIHPRSGVVMQVAIESCDPDAATVVWRDPETGERFETSALGGGAKMQWKADWAMRWHALGVDYEMSGKDLIDSVKLSGKVCRILGSEPPLGLTAEMFLDENGEKISKSRGNGISVDDWLRYAPAESLAQFMFNQPTRAKRLFFDVIPRAVDEYLANVERLRDPARSPAGIPAATEDERRANPAWFIHGGGVPNAAGSPLGFGMLLNLASVANAETPDVLWGFISRYAPGASPETAPFLARLAEHAVRYYRDFVRPAKSFRTPTDAERAALADLAAALRDLPADAPPDTVQDAVFEVGKRHAFEPLRRWFGCLYEVLLGQTEGPRFGIFASLYGLEATASLIDDRIRDPS